MKTLRLKITTFIDEKKIARLLAVFLLLFVFKAEAQNNALNFNSINNYVTCGNTIGNFGTSDFTIEFNILTTSNTGNPLGILSKRSICNHASFFTFTLKGGFFEFEIDQDTNGTNYTSLRSSGTLVNNGLWHHVAIIRSGTTLQFYIDGSAAGSTTASGIADISNATNLIIGNSICDNYFNGSLDELRIWNVARTQSQIQGAMDTGLVGDETGLITYYNFNQGTANGTNAGITTLNDITSNQNNGTLNNFSLSDTTSNWVSGVINPTIAGTVEANQTITASTGSGTSLVPIDKNLNGGGYANVGNGWFGPTNQAQSFKASISTLWTSLKINVNYVVNPGDVNLQVFSGDGVNGTLLHSQNVNIANIGINTITFLNPIALTAGQYYTFQLTDNGSADIYLDTSFTSSPLFPHYENGILTGGPLYFENAYQINNANWNNLTLTGNTGNILYWQSSTDAGFSNPTTIANTSTTLYSGLIGNLSVSTYFRAVVQYGGFPALTTNTVKVTVNIANSGTSTTILDSQCGTTLAALTSTISCYPVTGAISYKFKIVT